MTKTRTIRVQFTRPKKWFQPLSWVIRKLDRTDFSHVRLAWVGAAGRIPVIYEASGNYVKFIGPIAAKLKPVSVIHEHKFELTQEQYRNTVTLCMKYAGVEYGKKQLIGMGLVRVFRLKKNPYADGRKSQVCSEIIGEWLEKVLGWQIDLDLDVAGPKEIRETIDKRHGH